MAALAQNTDHEAHRLAWLAGDELASMTADIQIAAGSLLNAMRKRAERTTGTKMPDAAVVAMFAKAEAIASAAHDFWLAARDISARDGA